MKRIRRKRRPGRLDVLTIVQEFMAMAGTELPRGGRIVLTLWSSPCEVTEDDRVRLHQHLIDAHGATAVASLGLQTHGGPAERLDPEAQHGQS